MCERGEWVLYSGCCDAECCPGGSAYSSLSSWVSVVLITRDSTLADGVHEAGKWGAHKFPILCPPLNSPACVKSCRVFIHVRQEGAQCAHAGVCRSGMQTRACGLWVLEGNGLLW